MGLEHKVDVAFADDGASPFSKGSTITLDYAAKKIKLNGVEQTVLEGPSGEDPYFYWRGKAGGRDFRIIHLHNKAVFGSVSGGTGQQEAGVWGGDE